MLLALLDLSAALDTVDHKIMINRLEHVFCITGTALKWFKPYLLGRSQRVSIVGVMSHSCPLDCCVPQGSVLGLTMYSQYTRPIGDIIWSHGIPFHLFANDSYVYLRTNPNNPEQQVECFKKLESLKHNSKLPKNKITG